MVQRRLYCGQSFVAQFSAAKFTYGYFRNYFRGRIFTPSKREWVRATPLQHGSTWCGFKGSVVKTTNEIHILSMVRSMNIIQTGKGSTVVKMGTLQYCSSWLSICGMLKTPLSRWRLSMTLRRFWQIILRYFAFLWLTVTNLVMIETKSRHKNTPLLGIE